MEEGLDETSSKKKLGGWFRDMASKERWTVVISIICIISMLSVGWYVLTGVQHEQFTEFYVLNEQGQAYDYPRDLNVSEEASIIVGIANHEGRTVNYTVEVWLVNYTFIDMAVNVTQMYYLNGFTVVLEDVEYKLDEDWVPQYEKNIEFNMIVPGNFTVLILLFTDGAPAEPVTTPLDHSLDLAKTEFSWRVVMYVNKELPSLKLMMTVN